MAFWRERAKDSQRCEGTLLAMLALGNEAAVDRFITRCWDLVDERAKRRVAEHEAELLLEGDSDHGGYGDGLAHRPLERGAGFGGDSGEISADAYARMKQLSPQMLALHERFFLAEVDASDSARGGARR